MKISKKQAIGENLLYVMVWTAIILVPVLNSQMMSELHVDLHKAVIAWLQIVPYFVIFIIHNFLLAPRYMLRHKYAKYLASDLLLVIGIFWLVYIYDRHVSGQQVADMIDAAQAQQRISFTNLDIYWNTVLGFFMTGANSGIKLMYQSIRDEQELTELKQQNLQAEMDYLKYQINPHFFMNTLNNIHALIDIDPASAQNAVIDLSKMMRYVLYDSGSRTVTLEHDMQFIENYIALMRIRYAGNIDIKVEYPRQLPGAVSIPPLLLIVFVENAFKHGVSSKHPSFIHLSVACDRERITCTIANSLHPGRTDAHEPGIGLKNVRKRLELIYGQRGYTLDIREEARTYTVQLVIPAHHA